MRWFLAALLLLPTLALAAPLTATVSWTASLTRADGSTITGPVTFNVYQGASGKEAIVAPGIGSNFYAATSGLAAGGTVCFYVTEVETATGAESAPSAEVCKTFPASPPTAPTGIGVK